MKRKTIITFYTILTLIQLAIFLIAVYGILNGKTLGTISLAFLSALISGGGIVMNIKWAIRLLRL